MGVTIFRPGRRVVIPSPGVQAWTPVVTSAAFSPPDLADLWAWWDVATLSTLYQDSAGSTPVVSNGDPIGYIADRSGNGRYVRQVGSTTTRPTYTTGAQNGLPAPSFDGGDYLECVSSISLPYTIFAAVRRAGTVGATQGVIGNYHSTNTDGFQLVFLSNNTLRAGIGTPLTNNASISAVTANTPAILGGRFDSSVVDVALNGVIKTATHSATGGNNPIRVGTYFSNAGTQFFPGYICEICIYKRALSDLEIGQLTNYLNAKWGVF